MRKGSNHQLLLVWESCVGLQPSEWMERPPLLLLSSKPCVLGTTFVLSPQNPNAWDLKTLAFLVLCCKAAPAVLCSVDFKVSRVAQCSWPLFACECRTRPAQFKINWITTWNMLSTLKILSEVLLVYFYSCRPWTSTFCLEQTK